MKIILCHLGQKQTFHNNKQATKQKLDIDEKLQKKTYFGTAYMYNVYHQHTGISLVSYSKTLKQLLYNYSTFTDISPFLRPLLIPI